MAALINLIAQIGFKGSRDKARDTLGRVYEYFLGKFANAEGNRPELLADNVACLDYSVAKGGFLCAYRWNGEQKLKNENFVWVKNGKRPT